MEDKAGWPRSPASRPGQHAAGAFGIRRVKRRFLGGRSRPGVPANNPLAERVPQLAGGDLLNVLVTCVEVLGVGESNGRRV